MGTNDITLPLIPRTEILIDLKENAEHLPNCNCVPIAADTVANDRVIVETIALNGERALRFHFASEVGGPFGRPNPFEDPLSAMQTTRHWGGSSEALYEQFRVLRDDFATRYSWSPYAIYWTTSGEIYLSDGHTRYQVDQLERVALILASALSCVGFAQLQGAGQTAGRVGDGRALIAVAQDLYAARRRLRTSGALLPHPDRVEAQTKSSAGPRNSYAECDSPMLCMPPGSY